VWRRAKMPDSAIVSQMTPTELTSKRKIDSLLNKTQFLTPEKYAFLLVVDELLALITSPMSLLTLVDEVLLFELKISTSILNYQYQYQNKI